MNKTILTRLKKDLSSFKDEVFAILLYGSHVIGRAHAKSDIDICLVLKTSDQEKIKHLYHATLPLSGKNEAYDIKIFELLPLKIKFEVIDKGKILYAKNIQKLFEYFYFYRKLWRDQSLHWVDKG